MSPHSSDQRYFERQIVYARPIIIFLAILALFELPQSHDVRQPLGGARVVPLPFHLLRGGHSLGI
jgi:hypothetical protein